MLLMLARQALYLQPDSAGMRVLVCARDDRSALDAMSVSAICMHDAAAGNPVSERLKKRLLRGC